MTPSPEPIAPVPPRRNLARAGGWVCAALAVLALAAGVSARVRVGPNAVDGAFPSTADYAIATAALSLLGHMFFRRARRLP